MNLTDEQVLRQRLRQEFGALEISPAPVPSVTQRGRAARARRRALAAGTTLAAVLAVIVGALVTAQPRVPGTVTINPPDRTAPGGVFASGTADGRPWRLAVRNVNADPGTPWCLPAVMLNGHDGGILGVAMPHTYGILDGGVLTAPPGQPGTGFGFQRWSANVTRVVYRFPGGQRLDQRPVAVTACGQRFLLSGYSFTRAGVLRLTIYTRHGRTDTHFPLPDAARPWPPGQLRGLWSVGSSGPAASGDIGSGRLGGSSWTIKQTLGLGGQCFTAVLRQPAVDGVGRSSVCEPVSLPPRTAALDPISIPGAATELTGYAGLVNPRTAKVAVALSDGTIPPARPVNIAGRAYVAFAIPPGSQVRQLKLFDSAGHVFAITTSVPLPK